MTLLKGAVRQVRVAMVAKVRCNLSPSAVRGDLGGWGEGAESKRGCTFEENPAKKGLGYSDILLRKESQTGKLPEDRWVAEGLSELMRRPRRLATLSLIRLADNDQLDCKVFLMQI